MKLIICTCFVLMCLYIFPISSFDINDYKKEMITVSIQGEVKENKVVKIQKYTQLLDVLALVELTEDADISNLNPFVVLKDQDVIVIPRKTEVVKISINYASFEELLLIPGVGESKANKIIEYRKKNGLFQHLEDLMKIDGIKQKTFDKLKEYICL